MESGLKCTEKVASPAALCPLPRESFPTLEDRFRCQGSTGQRTLQHLQMETFCFCDVRQEMWKFFLEPENKTRGVGVGVPVAMCHAELSTAP